MNLRSAPTLSVLVLLLALSAGCSTPPPNVVLISIDTLRADHVGAYGYQRNTTPRLDALAAEGTVFLEAYAHAPNTAPSHSTLLTSIHPQVHGVWNHGRLLDPDLVTLAESFQEGGYATGAFVQLVGPTYSDGFETYEYVGDPTTGGQGFAGEEDLEGIVEWAAGTGERPFFLFVHTYDVHLPYEAELEVVRSFLGRKQRLRRRIPQHYVRDLNKGRLELTPERLREIVAHYDAELVRTDRLFGQMVDGLEARGLKRNTVFVVVSDHGEEFGERGQVGRHSYSLYNEVLRVPLIFAGPGVPRGVRVNAAVGLIDVGPTLLELAGLELPARFQGRDLAPLWRGEETESRTIVAGKRLQTVLISGGFKYHTSGRLYHLDRDPEERHDVSKTVGGLARQMRRDLFLRLREMERLAEDVESVGPQHLSPEERQKLRALGYLN